MDQGGNKIGAEEEDVFENAGSLKRLRRGVSMPSLQTSSPETLPWFDDFTDALPKGMLEKFGTSYFQKLYFSKNPEVQLALNMLMRVDDRNKVRVQTQLAKAGLDSLLDYLVK
jgi:hypothetical protein